MTKLTSEQIRQELDNYDIQIGEHTSMSISNRRLACIMEATNVILGYEPTGIRPPCVADSLCDAMITVNDSTLFTDDRARLKEIVPDIVGTAPTKMVNGETVKDRNERYRGKERERIAISSREYGVLADRTASIDAKLEVVRQMINVGGGAHG